MINASTDRIINASTDETSTASTGEKHLRKHSMSAKALNATLRVGNRR